MPPFREALQPEPGLSPLSPALNSEHIIRDIIVIGASAGGVQALIELLASMSPGLPATLAIVLHRGSNPGYLAQVLARRSTLPVVEPAERLLPKPGTIYLAPADRHLVFDGGAIDVPRGPKEHSTRPAVDPLFRSAAGVYGKRVVGIILTGGGDDGVRGLIEITRSGGLALAQDPDEAPMPYMPLHAVRYDHVGGVLSLKDLPGALEALAAGRSIDTVRSV
jgi:two-component system, chemotaxis family, protein-glutamate methylesterase/glutaminase